MTSKILIFLLAIIFSPKLYAKIPFDSLNCSNDSCFYQGIPFSGKAYRSNILKFKYKNGVQHGTQKEWYPNGTLKAKYKKKNGQFVGKYKMWNKEGQLTGLVPYKNGAVWGTQKSWYDNGNPESWFSFQNKKPGELNFHGLFKEWNEEGTLLRSYQMCNGQMHGPYKEWYSNGQLKIQNHYSNGQLEGEYIEYFENGNVEQTATLVFGVLVDTQKVYFKSGALKKLKTFDNDSTFYYYESGELNGKGLSNDSGQQGKWIWYYKNGQEIVTLNYEDGERIGRATYYNEDGSVDRIVEFENDEEKIIEKP